MSLRSDPGSFGRLIHKMIRPETVAALQSYASLPNKVQGVLVWDDGYHLGTFVTGHGDFSRVVAHADSWLCVKSFNLHTSLLETRPFVGYFVLRGSFVHYEDGSIVGICRVVKGKEAEGQQQAPPKDSNLLVSFRLEDALHCDLPQTLVFGTSTSTEALAPPLNYVLAVLRRHPVKCVVSCPSALFVIRGLPQISPVDEPRVIRVLENLVNNVDIVIQFQGPRTTLYRVAKNCIAVAGDGAESAIRAVQAQLELPITPPSAAAGRLASEVQYKISAGLLEPMDTEVTAEALGNLALSVEVLRQPLVNWHAPQVSLLFEAKVFSVQAQELPHSIDTKLVLKSGAIEVSAKVRYSDLRVPRGGETDIGLRQQLTRILDAAVRENIDGGHTRSQEALNSITQKLSDSLQTTINAARLFDSQVQVELIGKQMHSQGDSFRLPSGNWTVVPEYATTTSSARMCSYLGVFGHFGMQVSMYPWSPGHEGVMVTT